MAGCDTIVEPDCPILHSTDLAATVTTTTNPTTGRKQVRYTEVGVVEEEETDSDCEITGEKYPSIWENDGNEGDDEDEEITSSSFTHERRADLLVCSSGQFYGYLDIAVTHPLMPDLMTHHAANASTTPLYAAKLREKAKESKYRQCKYYDRVGMQPFVLETYGGMGSKAANFLSQLAEKTDEPERFKAEAIDRIAISLIRGNALIDKLGQHKIFTSELAAVRLGHHTNTGQYNLSTQSNKTTLHRRYGGKAAQNKRRVSAMEIEIEENTVYASTERRKKMSDRGVKRVPIHVTLAGGK